MSGSHVQNEIVATDDAPTTTAADAAVAITAAVASDFLCDLRRMTITRLSDAGYTADSTLGTEALVWNWLKIQHRRIEPRRRRIVRSSQLRAREASLPDELRSGIQRIEAAVQAGADLNPYLSRDLATDKGFKRSDMMLNELGVHHFHLGDGFDARGLVRGTRELLFACVTADAVHLIEVFDHDSFGDEGAFRIAQENWPDLFVSPLMGLAPSRGPQSITAEQRKALRHKHANVLVAASDGTLFAPPGGGITSSGMASRVLIDSDRIFDRVTDAERGCGENGAILADRFEAATGRRPTSFRLRFDGFDDLGATIVFDDDLGCAAPARSVSLAG